VSDDYAGYGETLEALTQRVAELERALGMVGRMAVYGPGSDTTEAQTLATIAAFVEKRLADQNWCNRP
jgi:hypothetical protein